MRTQPAPPAATIKICHTHYVIGFAVCIAWPGGVRSNFIFQEVWGLKPSLFEVEIDEKQFQGYDEAEDDANHNKAVRRTGSRYPTHIDAQ